MLLVEQFASAALAVADYGYVLENGRISVHGPAEKLRDDPGGQGRVPRRLALTFAAAAAGAAARGHSLVR